MMLALFNVFSKEYNMDLDFLFDEIREKTHFKCDEFITEYSGSSKFKKVQLKKGTTYCTYYNYLISSSKDINVRVRDGKYELSQSMIYKNPFFVGADYSEITCDDCDVKILSIFNHGDSNIKFVSLNTNSATIPFTMPAQKTSFGIESFANVPVKIQYNFENEEMKDIKSGDKVDVPISADDRNIKITILPDSTNNQIIPNNNYEGTDLEQVQFIGRIPKSGYAYKINDLKNEFNSPNSIIPENSQQGPETIDESIKNDDDEFDGDKFIKLSGFKCDYYHSILFYKSDYIQYTLPKDKTLCVQKPFLIVGDKEFQVKEKHFISDEKLSETKVYNSPMYVRSDISEITCDDCTVEVLIAKSYDFTYIVTNNNDALIDFTMPAGTRSFCVHYYNPTWSIIKYLIDNGEYKDTYSTNGFLEYMEQKLTKDTPVKIKISPDQNGGNNLENKKPMKYPKLIGRVPKTGYAFTANDLQKEYESPGSVTQENSELAKQVGSGTPTPEKKPDNENRTPVGLIIGIVVGVLAAIIIIVVVIVFVILPKRKVQKDSSQLSY